MEFEEFEAAVRGDCNIAEAVVSQGELREPSVQWIRTTLATLTFMSLSSSRE